LIKGNLFMAQIVRFHSITLFENLDKLYRDLTDDHYLYVKIFFSTSPDRENFVECDKINI
jgi:hypothetical protein